MLGLVLIFVIGELVLAKPARTKPFVCSRDRCADGTVPIDVCLYSKAMVVGDFGPLLERDCRGFAQKYEGTTRQDLENLFQRLKREKKHIRSAVFVGHGAPGEAYVGDFTFDEDIEYLNQYSEIFTRDADIRFVSCETGKGCVGDMLLARIAQSLLRKGGQVSAPESFAGTVWPKVLPRTSLNGADRVVGCTPGEPSPLSFSRQGLGALHDGGSLHSRCRSEFNTAYNRFEKSKTKAIERFKKYRCPLPPYVNGMAAIRSREQWFKNMNDPQYDLLRHQQDWSNFVAKLNELGSNATYLESRCFAEEAPTKTVDKKAPQAGPR